MRFHEPCPSCGNAVRWHHLLSSMLAPFYFRCKHCGARLRLKDSYLVIAMLAIILATWLACASAFVVAAVLMPTVPRVTLFAGLIALACLIGVWILLWLLFAGDRIVARTPGSREETAYALTLWVGLAIVILLTAASGFWMGIILVIFEELLGLPPP